MSDDVEELPGRPDVEYRPLDPARIMSDTLLRRATYLIAKRAINDLLKWTDLEGKRVAVLEAVRVCLECGLDGTQQDLLRIETVPTYSYDRLVVILVNIVSQVGENWEDSEPGPYMTLIKDTFEANRPESESGSKTRELEMLREMKELRSSMEQLRSDSPPPARPSARKAPAPKAPAPKTPAPKAKPTPKAKRAPPKPSSESSMKSTRDSSESEHDDDETYTQTERSTVDMATSRVPPNILLDGRRWADLVGYTWSDVKSALRDMYAKAYEDFSHDAGFITDILEGVFRTMNALPEWESTSLPQVVDRCVARLEYFRRRAQAPRNTSAAAELEDRILQRDLPEHIRGSRRYVDKHTPSPKGKK